MLLAPLIFQITAVLIPTVPLRQSSVAHSRHGHIVCGPSGNKPIIAVVGRPNVGKSTVANRMTQAFHKGALVFDEPGVTRDRTYGFGFWRDYEFSVVDTGGLVFEDDADEVFLPHIRQQAMVALGEASVALFIVDGQVGCTALDMQVASFLRKQQVPTILAVNKCESPQTGDLQAADFWQLGLGTPWPVSGMHGTGMGDLMDEVVKPLPLPTETAEAEEDESLRVAILGRPNVGKSSLLNRLTRTDRAIVSDAAGTTRDAIDQTVKDHGKDYIFVDTAGVRRKHKVHKGVEGLMVQRALKAARRADVCLLVLDATLGAAEQETRLSQFIVDSGRACVVLVNKWDVIANKDDALYRNSKRYLEKYLPAVSWATPVFVSAKTGLKVSEIFNVINKAAEQHQRRVTTSVMNEVLEDGVRWQKPPSTSTGRQGSIYYCAQVSTRPPTIAIFCNDPALFGETYRRYLEQHFRKSLGFTGTPVRLIFRGRKADQGGSRGLDPGGKTGKIGVGQKMT